MMSSTAATPRAPRMVSAARPTREERCQAQRARAARLVALSLWVAVPAIVALIVGLVMPLFVGAVRLEALGTGSVLLLVAGGLLLRGRREMRRARRAYAERPLHAVRVDRGGAA